MDPNLVDLLARSPRVAFASDLAAKATLILAAAGAAAMALRRSSAASRHLAWCLGLGAALALPALSLALPGWSWRVLPAAAETVHRRSSAADSPAPVPHIRARPRRRSTRWPSRKKTLLRRRPGGSPPVPAEGRRTVRAVRSILGASSPRRGRGCGRRGWPGP